MRIEATPLLQLFFRVLTAGPAGIFAACVAMLLPMPGFAEPDSADAADGEPLAAMLSPGMLEAHGALVGEIHIQNGNVFDIEDPLEDNALFRFANKVHLTTRPEVIAQQLLFESGSPFSMRELEESERILRSNRYLEDATIEPVANENGGVDIDVRTTDGWTLIPKVSFSRAGGENNSGIGVKDMNLLGTGIGVELLYRSDVDRDSAIVRVLDSQIGNSWYALNTTYADNSDGHEYLLDVEKPFYSLDSHSAHGFSFFDNDQIDSLYERGEVVGEFRSQASTYQMYAGWSRGLINDWTKRLTTGIAYDEHRYNAIDNPGAQVSLLPEDRLLIYPFIGFELVQDRFEKTENYDHINRTEDRYLGTRLTASLGFAQRAFGSDRDALLVSAGAQKGFGSSQKNSLLLDASLTSRIEDAGTQNFMTDVSARYYRRQSERRLFFLSLSGTYGHNLDLDNQLLLGGDSGLRGYPLRYQSGDKRTLLTLEQRYFTDLYLFRLLRVGGAVFFDAGRAWGDSPTSTQKNKLLRDVGFGLRMGSTRSGEGRMLHVDLAFPLDGDASIDDLQFVVQTKKSF